VSRFAFMSQQYVPAGILFAVSIPLAVALAASGAAAPDSAVPPVTWDLTQQYPSDSAWNASFADVEARAAEFAMLRSARITRVRQLADLLDEADFLRGRARNLARFALLIAVRDYGSVVLAASVDHQVCMEGIHFVPTLSQSTMQVAGIPAPFPSHKTIVQQTFQFTGRLRDSSALLREDRKWTARFTTHSYQQTNLQRITH
jgi:hypothetical protein